MILDNYIDDSKEILDALSNKLKTYNTGENKNARKQAVRDMEDFIFDLIDEKVPNLDDDVVDNIVDELSEYLINLKLSEKVGPKTLEEGMSKRLSSLTLGNILYENSPIRGQRDILLSRDFNKNLVSVNPERTVKIDRLETQIKSIINDNKNQKKNTGVALTQPFVLNNLKSLTEAVRKSIKEGTREYKVNKYNLHLDKIFGTKTGKFKELAEREATYKYWEDKAKEEKEMIKNLKELLEVLKEVQEDLNPDDVKKNKSINEFVSFVDKNIDDLQYIKEFNPVYDSLEDIEVRAVKLLKEFAEIYGVSMSMTGAEEGLQVDYEDDEPSDDDEDDKPPSIGEGDTINPQAKEAISELEENLSDEQEFDPLGLLVLKEDLGAFAAIYGEVEELKAIAEEKKERFQLDQDDEEALFSTFLDKIEAVEEFADKERTFTLPIFAADLPALKIHYRKMGSDINKITQNIDRFLELFGNLIEEDKTLFPQKINVDMLGASRAGKTGEQVMRFGGKQPKPQFQYLNTVLGGKGTIREKFSKTQKLDRKIGQKINAIVKPMIEIYLGPQFTIHSAGMDLPFTDNAAVRIISSYKNLDEKYVNYQALNRKFAEYGESLISDKDAQKMLNFTQLLTKGDVIQSLEELRTEAVGFAKTVFKIFKDIDEETESRTANDRLKNRIHKEVASLVGSIQVLSPKSEDEPLLIGRGWRKNIRPLEEYEELGIDRVSEISAIKALSQLITSSKGDAIIDGDIGEKLISDFKTLAKSEIHDKLLAVHDSIRIIKNQPIHYSFKRLDEIDHLDMMIAKMEKEYNLDISANEISNIVNKIDSFSSISKEYGISTEHVYVIKANFR